MTNEGLSKAEQEKLRLERQAATAAEIDEMDDVIFGGKSLEEERPVAEEKPQEKVREEKEEREVPVEAAPEEILEPEVVLEETPTSEEAPLDDEYDFSFINELARNTIEKMASKPTEIPTPTPAPAKPAESAQPAAPAPVFTAPSGPLATKEEMEEAFNSPDKFLELLGRVYQRAVFDAQEQALQRLPSVAQQVAIQTVDRTSRVAQFYKDNPELSDYPDFVRFCALQIEAKHPDWDSQTVMKETAKLAKSRIPMIARAKRDQSARPALPGSGRVAQRRSSAQAGLSALEREIAEMPDGF